jgi:Ca-activated chloride channel family protein
VTREHTELEKGTRRPGLWIAAALMLLTTAGALAARSGTGRTDAIPPAALHYAAPLSGPVRFEGALDRGSLLAGGDGIVKLELRMAAEERPAVAPVRVPTDLTVVLDRSGSMNGEPLAHAKAAVRELVARLSPGDRFALVTFASDGDLRVPLAPVASGRERFLAAIDAVRAGGGTAMSRGLDLAAQALASGRATGGAGRAVRVVLVSDGHANEGDPSFAGLRDRAARAVAGEYVLSTVGVGEGFDEHLMAALADAGTGNFYYLQHVEDLGAVFAGEFESARQTVATALRVAIEPGPGVEVVDAAGYPLERERGRVSFRPGDLFAGQDRRIWVTLRARDGEPGLQELGRFTLAYRAGGDLRELAFSETPQVARVAQAKEFFAAVDQDAFDRQLASDGVGSLKHAVAEAMRVGDLPSARAVVEEFLADSTAFYARMGRDAGESKAVQEAEDLRGLIDAAVAPSAPAEAPNRLRKQLSVEAVDGRRQGAKLTR